ncbi:MAG: glycine cleavage system protein GcvH [Deltaproteobacteria bacterium]|jgi:glycine cleavage system H protein
MKAIEELTLPDDVRYTEDHEWAVQEGDQIAVGLTDYAQDQLGDIVFVELPGVGESFEKGAVFGTVESVKAVAELFSPTQGRIVEINTSLEDAPELANTSPYEKGWLVRMAPSGEADVDTLMDKAAYLKFLEGLA